MKKTLLKLLTMILAIMLVMTITMTTTVFAAPTDDDADGAPAATGDDKFSPNQLSPNTTGNGTQAVQNLGNTLIGLLQTAGVVVAVIVLIVLGIKYMMGSTAEKAEYKKTMMPYFVGAILIFGAIAVAEVVFQFTGNLNV